MDIPVSAGKILGQLRNAGFSAYVVGGCVRDGLLGKQAHDWDICTSALPEETIRCFSHLKVIETGRKHGTVTVMYEGEPYEITTFRKDGDYLDHRRPKQVDFVTDLREDLARRDFTINAMAADPEGEVIDLFGGREDLQAQCIRCVGNPDKRFEEDALRILRAMRFASQLGFSVEPETRAAMIRNRQLLSCISGERIFVELTKLLAGKAAKAVLHDFPQVLGVVVPEILPSMDFCQHNPYHDMDVWQHTLKALGESGQDTIVRWSLLLHDLGKPQCFTMDDRGIGHFYGHPTKSAELAKEIFTRFHGDNRTRNLVCTLVQHHDDDCPAAAKAARRLVGHLGGETALLLMEVRRCDILAHRDTPKTRMRWENHLEMTRLVRKAVEEAQCCKISDLQITGSDVLALGVPKGPEVGQLLQRLLEDVMEENCPNEQEALQSRLKTYVTNDEVIHGH